MQIAFLSSIVPALGVYLVKPSLIAFIPASAIAAGVSKSGSPAARPMTGTPAWRSALAWSVMAMVLEGRSALTRGLMDVSTASALTAAILTFLVPCPLSHDALEKETEPAPGEGLVGRVKDEEEEEGVAREENAIGVVCFLGGVG